MAQFRYQAKAGPDDLRRGVIEADTAALVAARLRQEGLFLLSVEEVRQGDGGKDARVSSADIALFTRQLADLLCSGFTLNAALCTLGAQARTPVIAGLIGELREGIEHGTEFSETLARHPASFNEFYVSMVRIGEADGKLDDSLKRLADFKEREEEFLAQFKSALVYPAFLFFAGIASIFVLSAFFIPRLARLFADFQQAMPLSTRMVIFAGSLAGRFWWLFIALAVCAAIAVRSFMARERNRMAIDRALLRIPVVKDIVGKMESARFSYALGVLLQSGIPILECLGVAGLNIANRRMREVVGSFHEKIRRGRSLSSCLKEESALFPEILYRMAAVGEESGDCAEMLLKAAAVFETEVNRSLKKIVSLIEPCLVLFIGGIMVLIVFSILLPVFQLDFFPK